MTERRGPEHIRLQKKMREYKQEIAPVLLNDTCMICKAPTTEELLLCTNCKNRYQTWKRHDPT